jgi:hypothetical protein
LRYLIAGSKNDFSEDIVYDALSELTSKDEVLITASSPVEDIAARISFEVGASLKTKDPDNALQGTFAKEYSLNKLAKNADVMIVFYSNESDEAFKKCLEIASNNSIELRTYKNIKN